MSSIHPHPRPSFRLVLLLLAAAAIAMLSPAGGKANRARADPLPTSAVLLPFVAKNNPCAPVPTLLTPPDGTVASEVTMSWSASPGGGPTFLRVERPEKTLDFGTFGPLPFSDGGTWTWTVRERAPSSQCFSPWASPRAFTIPVLPFSGAPSITSPTNGAVIQTGRPNVSWTAALHGGRPYTYTDTYQIQVDDDPAFNSPELDGGEFTGTSAKLMWLAYDTPQGFPFYSLVSFGVQNLRVRASSLDGDTGAWSAGRQFTVAAPYNDCKSNGTGPKVLSVSGGSSDPDAPRVTRIDISEIEPGVGGFQTLTIYAAVNAPGTIPIETVDVALVTDAGEATPVTFALSSGTALNGQWTGGWTMPGTYCYNYGFAPRVVNAVDEANLVIIARNN